MNYEENPHMATAQPGIEQSIIRAAGRFLPQNNSTELLGYSFPNIYYKKWPNNETLFLFSNKVIPT